jgi:hypothetical protein
MCSIGNQIILAVNHMSDNQNCKDFLTTIFHGAKIAEDFPQIEAPSTSNGHDKRKQNASEKPARPCMNHASVKSSAVTAQGGIVLMARQCRTIKKSK